MECPNNGPFKRVVSPCIPVYRAFYLFSSIILMRAAFSTRLGYRVPLSGPKLKSDPLCFCSWALGTHLQKTCNYFSRYAILWDGGILLKGASILSCKWLTGRIIILCRQSSTDIEWAFALRSRSGLGSSWPISGVYQCRSNLPNIYLPVSPNKQETEEWLRE